MRLSSGRRHPRTGRRGHARGTILATDSRLPRPVRQASTSMLRGTARRGRASRLFSSPLALNPPAAPTVPSVDAPPSAEPSPSEAMGSPWWARLALGGRIEHSPTAEGRSSPAASLGAELGAVVGKRALGVTVAGGVLAPTVVTFGSVPVREQRFPLRVAAAVRHKMPGPFRARGRSRSVVRSSEAPQRNAGHDRPGNASRRRRPSGPRAESAVRWHRAGLPSLHLHVEYFPRPYEFEVGPLGRIGSTDRLWVGASAGLSWQTGAARYSARQ